MSKKNKKKVLVALKSPESCHRYYFYKKKDQKKLSLKKFDPIKRKSLLFKEESVK